MKIENNKLVSVIYELREGNSEGRVLDIREPSEEDMAARSGSCSGCGSEGDSSCSCNC